MQELYSKPSQGLLGANIFIKDGILFYKGKIGVPEFEGLRDLLSQEFHATLQASHGGVLKTNKGLGELFFWLGMKQDVLKYVEGCPLCQATKYVLAKP